MATLAFVNCRGNIEYRYPTRARLEVYSYITLLSRFAPTVDGYLTTDNNPSKVQHQLKMLYVVGLRLTTYRRTAILSRLSKNF